MSLASIVSGIVQKESKIDRKKMAYFFKDVNAHSLNSHPVGLFLRIMKPETITILSVQQEFDINDNIGEKIGQLTKIVSVLFPEVKVDVVNGHIVQGHAEDRIVLADGTPVDKEKLMTVDVGFYIDIKGSLYAYKAEGLPSNVKFHIDETDDEGLEELRDADLDVLLPTENMWLVNELTRNREAEITICYFGDQPKRKTVSKVTQITNAILNSSIKARLHTAYFLEDFKGWETEKESVALFDIQYDFVLVIRGDRVDVHLPFDNGHVSKEPNGWLLLN